MLGPVRFEHIKNCAREAISKYLNSTQQQQSQVKKARTVADDEEKRRANLIRVLPERDRSISVLRGLLAEKQGTESSSLKEEKVASPAKVPEYSKLPLKTLENLERARDATIGWILAQIEKAEVAQQAEILQQVGVAQQTEIPQQLGVAQQAEAPQEAEVGEKTEVASDAG